ncbi:MAG: hypothetical protein CSA34_05715 [Desulfobulbus propionicus]|nr:MAG: hypothetical protein CSA34_05715 [Desulfobulbus propionicus]
MKNKPLLKKLSNSMDRASALDGLEEREVEELEVKLLFLESSSEKIRCILRFLLILQVSLVNT